MKKMKVTQSENIQAILDERKWMKECKEAYENLIDKWKDKSWKWIPNGFFTDFMKVNKIRINRKRTNSNKETFDENMVKRKTLHLFFELEKTITNPYFFWSLVAFEYSQNDYHQDVLLEWLEAFTRYDRLELTLEQRQKCADNMGELAYRKRAKNKNYTMWKTLKDMDEITIYRGASIPKDTYVRMDKKKLNNPNAHRQDGGLGFSYTLDKDCANYFANIIAVENNEMMFSNSYVGEIPKEIEIDTINETSKRVISKHSIKKEKILFYTNFGNEHEIVALPDDVDLITYDLHKRNGEILHPSTKWKHYTLYETGNKVYSPTGN